MSKNDVPFVNEVEKFNFTMGKPNNYEPTIPEKKEWQFVYDFILEELEEYKEACEKGDIVEILDALCDIAYVSDVPKNKMNHVTMKRLINIISSIEHVIEK